MHELSRLEERLNNVTSRLTEIAADLGAIQFELKLLKSGNGTSGTGNPFAQQVPAQKKKATSSKKPFLVVRPRVRKGQKRGRPSRIKPLITEFIEKSGGTAKAKDIVDYVSSRYESSSSNKDSIIRTVIQDMYRKGQLVRVDKGTYALAGQTGTNHSPEDEPQENFIETITIGDSSGLPF